MNKCSHITFTKQGIELLQTRIVAVDKVEAQYADVSGKKRFQDLKQALGELHSQIIKPLELNPKANSFER